MRRVIKEGEKKEDYCGPYDSICGVRLPRGLDPHSVPAEELSASLGYMLQFINIAVRILFAPALHVSGFKVRSNSLPESHIGVIARQLQLISPVSLIVCIFTCPFYVNNAHVYSTILQVVLV